MAEPGDRRRVYMYFQFRDGWDCSFLEADLKTSLHRRLRFASAEKIVQLVERGEGSPIRRADSCSIRESKKVEVECS
jgi:hypothetical protein